jgi:hypothetical protein
MRQNYLSGQIRKVDLDRLKVTERLATQRASVINAVEGAEDL